MELPDRDPFFSKCIPDAGLRRPAIIASITTPTAGARNDPAPDRPAAWPPCPPDLVTSGHMDGRSRAAPGGAFTIVVVRAQRDRKRGAVDMYCGLRRTTPRGGRAAPRRTPPATWNKARMSAPPQQEAAARMARGSAVIQGERFPRRPPPPAFRFGYLWLHGWPLATGVRVGHGVFGPLVIARRPRRLLA